jgi:hypothetical protein
VANWRRNSLDVCAGRTKEMTDLSPSEMIDLLQPGDTIGASAILLSIVIEHWPMIVNQCILEGEYGEAVAEDLMELMGKLGEVP